MNPKLKPIFKSEPNKPSQKKGWLVGIMLSWEWEKVTAKLANLFKRKGK